MGLKFNGKTKEWALRISILVGILTMGSWLYTQTVDKGKMLKSIENNGDRNLLLEARIEKRDVKFDTFLVQQTKNLIQQTKKNTIDRMNTVALMKYIDSQIELNKQQVIFNGEVKEHMIREDN